MEKSMELFSGPIRIHALLFADAEAKDYEKVAAAVKEAAVKFRTQVGEKRGGGGSVFFLIDLRPVCARHSLVPFFIDQVYNATIRQQALSVEVPANESRILEAFDLKDRCARALFLKNYLFCLVLCGCRALFLFSSAIMTHPVPPASIHVHASNHTCITTARCPSW